MPKDAIVTSDLAAEELLPALETNMFEFFTGYGRTPGGEVYQDASYLRVYTGLPYAMFNGIFGAQLSSGTLDHAIDAVIEYMAAKKAACCWYVTPGVRPASLGDHLTQHGFTLGASSPGMWIDLDLMKEHATPPPGLEIHLVEKREMVRAWAEVAWDGTGFAEAGRQRFLDMETFLGIDSEACRLRYLAFLNGKPVATSLLFLHAGVAGIQAVSTLPEARRQGIGRAMTLAPVWQARELGYHIATLQASPMGNPIYRRLGFEEIFQVQEYDWNPT
jgi:GNAT superfamily N-acetyltransferase